MHTVTNVSQSVKYKYGRWINNAGLRLFLAAIPDPNSEINEVLFTHLSFTLSRGAVRKAAQPAAAPATDAATRGLLGGAAEEEDESEEASTASGGSSRLFATLPNC